MEYKVVANLIRLVHLKFCIAAALLFCLQPAFSQTYPNGIVRIIVPFAPGGGVDYLARTIGEKLSERWKQAIVVENRVGAGGVIGSDFVARSMPDGATLLVIPLDVLVNPTIYTRLQSDPVKKLTPIASLSNISYFLASNPNSGISSVSDLIEKARQHPGTLSYGSCGAGHPPRVLVERLVQEAKIQLTHVAYRGGCGAAVNDAIGGHIPLVLSGSATIAAPLAGGLLKAIAIMNPERDPQWPDVPTLAESGYPSLSMTAWIGLFGPPDTPLPIANKINEDLLEIYKDAVLRKGLADRMVPAKLNGADEFGRIIKNTVAPVGEILTSIVKTEEGQAPK
jgi:tripartite-type tricarboxylate transporter receptor subunit TctC